MSDGPAPHDHPAPPTHEHLERRALWLAYFTVGYNVLEGLISVTAAALAGSTALFGFGVDSFVESLSGGVIIWRFGRAASLSCAQRDRREERAVRLVGGALLVMGAWIAYESVAALVERRAPDRSMVGMVIAVVSLIVMPVLYAAKRRVSRQLGSGSLAADSQQTLACTFLSAALLVGLGLHYTFGWWAADPLVGLAISVYLARAGWRAIRERELCCA